MRTSGFRFTRFVVTNSLSPLMTDTTATTVMTPITTPKSVSPERSLWLPRARNEVAKSSRRPMALGRAFRRPRLEGLLLLLAHRLDPVPFLDGPERLEGAADDALAVLEAARDLDVQLAGEPGLDGHEVHLAAGPRVDARLGLHPPRGVLLAVGRVAYHDRRQRDGRNLGLGPRDDVRGDREAGPDGGRRLEDLHLHLEV